jgi:CheY-like chemotaxis protein
MTAAQKDVLCGAHVLVVDDDADFVSYVRSVFAHAGCACVDVAYGGLPALEHIADDGPYDLVVTDVRMPGPSGTQLAAMARTAGYEVPFLVVTAFPDGAVYRVAQTLDHTEVLGKPFAPPQALEMARTLIRSGRASRVDRRPRRRR